MIKRIGSIADGNPGAAPSLWERLDSSVLQLSAPPYIYRPRQRVPGTREMVAHPNYLVVYQVKTEVIDILRVLHVRQQYPS